MSSLPSLTTVQSPGDLFQYFRCLLTDPRYFLTLAVLVVLGDTVLTQLIIRFVPYTEIDWETYMYQLELYLKGERDYALISGPTGPLVYPAGHVYVHKFLYGLTQSGINLKAAQQIYGLLYITALATTCGIYYKAGNIPNWVLMILPLSKRLHSIYVLRLFNDCWEVVGTQATTLAFASGYDSLGIMLFSASVSIKMSALLYLPGILVVLVRRRGFLHTIGAVGLLAFSQVAIGWPFIQEYPRSYLSNAFEFSRQFLYKWTVNWRFVPEEMFLSSVWARTLLVLHLGTLVIFGFRWCRRDGGALAVLDRTLRRPSSAPSLVPLSADYVVTALFTSNLIGIIFARSLHYQFYSWYASQIPFLLWRTKYSLPVKFVILLGIEYAWNVYPSTNLSSAVLCGANLFLVLGVYFGYPEGRDVPSRKLES
ncbi:glycosyltransferase family 58 protein [Phanerochaete carnosa HHB-10118-sp]|uniref:Dol-P-Man:Man(5)GlcNAc(2)-PP-Dol alpha-1,3-mannosyltransferase n=1 Tax=Phanerochaete carnosa (strain HHB-10118-sp) TaxID=650164 RepID=K5UZ89_PHACS|nr:glycosyltransferase family 58 protein [Phanerochaete carnosa HHB-10118-sp]EKM55481.1 glycosyltransferase family 58 protein [Phanerochaete carnosa HHB-10118-sp]